MQRDRDLVIQFYKKRKTPVVDFSEPDSIMLLLNPNSYEKGSWVLHMLRRKLGDNVFQKSIQTYYATYKGSNASTGDFMHIMEKVSKKNLGVFFKQWLYTAGYPIIKGEWKYDNNRKSLHISINQKQDYVFYFPLQLAIRGAHQSIIKTINITNRNNNISLPLNFEPSSIIPDPNVNLLFEGDIAEGK